MSCHTHAAFDGDLQRLQALVVTMAECVSLRFTHAVQTLDNLEQPPLPTPPLGPDREAEMTALCVGIIARWQPVGADLRLIMASLKLALGYTRIDQVNEELLRVAGVLAGQTQQELSPRLWGMARIAEGMAQQLKQHYLLLVRYADDEAESVEDQRPVVDIKGLRHRMGHHTQSLQTLIRGRTRELVTFMLSEPRATPRVLELLFALRALEMMADQVCDMLSHLEVLAWHQPAWLPA